jgi:hypothetical protein
VQSRLDIGSVPSAPWGEVTLFMVTPRLGSLMAWLAFAGWTGTATALSLTVAALMGLRSPTASAAVILVTAAVVWVAHFVPPQRRVERRVYPVGALTPAERRDLRRCVTLVARHASLSAAALPGPVAEHLDEVHHLTLDRLTDALARAERLGHSGRSRRVVDQPTLGTLACALDEMVGHAERLIHVQRHHGASRSDSALSDSALRTAVLADVLDPGPSRSVQS